MVWVCVVGLGMDVTYLYGELTVNSDSGSNRKCSWVTLPVEVSMVTTGKPIWSTQ